ncbi:glycosyltransferase [Candidatus Bipolaricaulota bacterium]
MSGRRQEFDLIHLHNIHGYCLNLSIAGSLAELGTPVVWTLHDAWPLTGRCAYSLQCDRWKNGCGQCPDMSRYPKGHFDTSAFMWKRKKAAFTQQWNPTIVCPSKWLADQVRESYLRKSRIEIIPNGIDTDTFTPKEKATARKRLGLPLKKKIVLFVAADLADERKGARYFFESLQHIKGDDWMVLTLGKRVNLSGKLPERVDVKQLGYISNRDSLAEMYSVADVLCVSSLDEVFGLVVTESMACGTPVVGFRVGGILEQITDDCGALVEPRDVKGLGEAITKLLQDDDLREKMSVNCRDRAVAEYSISKFRDRYVSLYHEIAEGGI